MGLPPRRTGVPLRRLGAAIGGSDRPLILTSGTLLAQRQGSFATEEDAPNPSFPRKSEELRWRHAESAHLYCGFPLRSTETAITALCHA